MFIDPATTWVHGTRLYLFGDKVPLSNDHQELQYHQYLIGDKVPHSNDHLKLQFPQYLIEDKVLPSNDHQKLQSPPEPHRTQGSTL